jgi:hypothetical protein
MNDERLEIYVKKLHVTVMSGTRASFNVIGSRQGRKIYLKMKRVKIFFSCP